MAKVVDVPLFFSWIKVLCAVRSEILGMSEKDIDKRKVMAVGSSVFRFFGMYPAMGVALYRRGVMDNLAR